MNEETNQKHMENLKYIGRYFRRILNDERDSFIFKIIGYDGEYFITTSYYLTLGTCVRTINDKISAGFLQKDNFKETTEQDFFIVSHVCANPVITIWDENMKPIYLKNTYTL